MQSIFSNASINTGNSYGDQIAAYIIIDKLFTEEPERFGSLEQQEALKAEIHDFFALSKDCKPDGLLFILDFLKRNNINPFSDISIAFLGAETSKLFPSTQKEQPILEPEFTNLFSRFEDYQPDRLFHPKGLTLSNSLQASYSRSFDFVVSANVLNFPYLIHPRGVMAGCSNLAKVGGVVAHVLNISRDNIDGIVNNDRYHEFLGQRQLSRFDELCAFILLEQQKEKLITRDDIDLFVEKEAFVPHTSSGESIRDDIVYG